MSTDMGPTVLAGGRLIQFELDEDTVRIDCNYFKPKFEKNAQEDQEDSDDMDEQSDARMSGDDGKLQNGEER
jgi:hypothetical protein